MAQKIITLLTSDLSGDEAATTVDFGLDGASYTLDMTDQEADDFREVLAPYVAAARRTGGTRRRTQVGPAGTTTKAIREWARGQGLNVPDRGRIPKEIVSMFENAEAQALSRATTKKDGKKNESRGTEGKKESSSS